MSTVKRTGFALPKSDADLTGFAGRGIGRTASFQSRTWTKMRSPLRVVTPQGRGGTGPPRVP